MARRQRCSPISIRRGLRYTIRSAAYGASGRRESVPRLDRASSASHVDAALAPSLINVVAKEATDEAARTQAREVH